jgi:hypothetical protein
MGILRRQGTEQRDAKGRWLSGVTPAGARPWRKGRTPNLTGKGSDYHEMQRVAREFTPRATEILRDIANDPSEDSRNRIDRHALRSSVGQAEGLRSVGRQRGDPLSFRPEPLHAEQLAQIEAALRLVAATQQAAAEARPQNRVPARRPRPTGHIAPQLEPEAANPLKRPG